MQQGSRADSTEHVTGDDEGLVSHAGVVWLAGTAEVSGLTVGVPQRRHDAGRALAQMVLALAD